ncbi:hypothetical protein [Lactovum miscens]|uniref:TrbL/VirB6 plasmid conjugal transfer protein n=1 Tax=Lactovum miscens TaxID=190387 RepID=A0A841C875_9LACT|nr:hypothetical protein [Lactovum miscens]MBB5887599.1 hypothetical protein [Lactovum miscens]
MDISQTLISQLTKGLNDYNPTVNQMVTAVASALRVLALAGLTILFLIELSGTYKKLDQDGGGLTIEVLAEIALKYLFAWILVMFSDQLIDGIAWLGAQVVRLIAGHTTINYALDTFNGTTTGMNFIEKGLFAIVELVAQMVSWLAQWIAQILVFMRSVQLYLYKAIAPIIIVFFMNDEMRSTAIGFLKQFGAIVLQAGVMLLVLAIFPSFMTSDLLSMNVSGLSQFFQDISVLVQVIVKMVILIIVLLGSQNLAKRILGAM